MNERIQHFIEAEGLTPTRFADAIGVQRSNVSHVLNGRNKPGFDFLEKMLRCYPNLNAGWLMMGEGSMYKDDAPKPMPKEPGLFSGYGDFVSDEDPAPYNFNRKPKLAEPLKHTEVQNTTQLPTKQGKRQLVRVILCYSDGSFEAYDGAEGLGKG